MSLHLLALGTANAIDGERIIRMVNEPALSPDGKQIAFRWGDDLWTVGIEGGAARRLTHHPATDAEPRYSPDGSKIAFVSRRTGSPQLFVMPATGGVPEQKTFHTEGYSLADWFPDGNSLLAIGQRDHYWRNAERLLRVYLTERRNEEVLVDAAALDAKLSPDGKRVLFVREGERWWRKGYRGERAAQIWQLDLQAVGSSEESGNALHELLHEGVECRWPLWQPNGKGFYFTKGDEHGFDLWRYRFRQGEKGRQRYVVGFDEDSIVEPTSSPAT